MYELLLFLHIAFAATLLGAPLGLPRNLKTALGASPDAFKVAAKDAKIRGHVAGASSLVNFLTGVGLIFYKGGFATIAKSYHAAMGLMIVAIIVGVAMMKPTTTKLVELSEAPSLDADAARKQIKKLAMSSGIVQLIWAVILFLMIKPFG